MEEDIVKVFIGSSKEGKEYAEALQILIDENCEATIWDQGIFTPGITTIESLNKELDKFDLAIFIFTPDDRLISRGEEKNSIRDNLIFELGLAMGKLGYGRAIFVIPKNVDIKIPSDIFGINCIEFNSRRKDGNIRAAMGTASTEVKDIIKCIKNENRNLKINQIDRHELESVNIEIGNSLGHIISFSSHNHCNGIIFFDVDKMRNIKEIYGDEVADRVTSEVKNITRDVCKEQLKSYFFTRIYTDSFAVILDEDQIYNISNSIISNINKYDWREICIELFVHVSIGVAIREEEESYENWIKRAIHSCRMAKVDGGNKIGKIIKYIPPIYRKIHLFDQFSP